MSIQLVPDGLRVGGAAVVFAVGLVACAPVHQPPQPVDATAPSVTYSYGTDDELVAANSKARAYCAQYQSVPSLEGPITENEDGTKTATFKCVESAPAAAAPAPVPMTYTYSGDMQLLQAMRSAENYCQASGRRTTSNIVTNSSGSKTITFQCVPQ